MRLTDGTRAKVRILGFRHDDRVAGGKAGIRFEFADVPTVRRMNPGRTNRGGWRDSEMRGWLDGEFLDLLPQDLANRIARVRKRTNNRGKVERAGDTSTVTATEDRLWFLSLCEVYGGGVTYPSGNDIYSLATYCAEGTQYQLYADRGVSSTSYDICKDGADSWWWLRSPDASDSGSFLLVRSDGVWGRLLANRAWGVSPCFCL